MALFRQAKDAFFHPQYGWKTTNFWGPIANWGIVLAAVNDAVTKGPETISPVQTSVLLAYSGVFTRFALRVKPANYLLFACHTFNIAAQGYQLTRWSQWHDQQSKIAQTLPQFEKDALLKKIGPGLPFDKIGMALACAAGGIAIGQKVLKPLITNLKPTSSTSFVAKAQTSLLHPAGPFHIHFWAPLFKWALSINNILELDRDINQISLPQQVALATTGFIWSRYSLVITPKNYSLFLVNFVLGLTSAFHIGRKIKGEMAKKEEAKNASASVAAV